MPLTGQPASTTLANADQLLRQAIQQLAHAGVESPTADAKTLFAWAWDISVSELGSHVLRGTAVPCEVSARYAQACERRAAREPLQHITGVAPFRYQELHVGPGVFIPRPETELMVSHVVEYLAGLPGDSHTAVDLCTGSGAIAIALATEVPRTHVHAVELSPEAASYTEHNIDRYRPAFEAHGSAVTLHIGDATEFLGTTSAQVITCNPPYVARSVEHAPEVASDPDLALYGGGADGSELPQKIIAHAPRILAPGGLLICEHAEYNAHTIENAFHRAGFTSVETVGDYTGRDRFTRGYSAHSGEDDRVSHI